MVTVHVPVTSWSPRVQLEFRTEPFHFSCCCLVSCACKCLGSEGKLPGEVQRSGPRGSETAVPGERGAQDTELKEALSGDPESLSGLTLALLCNAEPGFAPGRSSSTP